MAYNLFFGDSTVRHGTFEKFHAQNVVMHSDSTVNLFKDPATSTTSLTVGSKEQSPSITHLVVADKFRGRSDARLKSQVRSLDGKACLDAVTRLTGKEYRFKQAKTKSYGMIAQDVKLVLPDIVSEDSDGYLNISYLDLIPFLIESLKETNRKLEELNARVISQDLNT